MPFSHSKNIVIEQLGINGTV